MKRIKLTAGLVMTGLIVSVLGGCGSNEDAEPTSSSETKSAFNENSPEVRKKTKEIEDLIDSHFYYEEDDQQREEMYYAGIVAGLGDPYSVYYTKEEMERMKEDDSGEYVGIGASVAQRTENGQIYVVKPLRGSPAEAAGLLPEDVFVEIDGVKITSNMSLDEVVTMIRGSQNTTAELKMYRQGESDYLTFNVPRGVIQNITVEYELLENGFGYIEVSQFLENSYDQFKEAVDYLTAQGAKALIIDMRNNPGGFTTSACKMVDYLLEDSHVAEGDTTKTPGLLLLMKDKNQKIVSVDACQDGHSVDLPIAILTNESTASSSEIFTGAMKDHKKAIQVGMKTFGKGVVQIVYPLEDGSGVKLTIAGYFLPNGESIHDEGIEPDVEIDMDLELRRQLNLPHNQDVQLQKAITELGGEPLP